MFPSAGTYDLPINSLRDPPAYLRVREVKEWYVEYLTDVLLKEEGDHEDLTSPLLVIASVAPADFKQSKLTTYTYEVYCIVAQSYYVYLN